MSLAWTAYRMIAPCLGAVAPAAEVFTSPQERPLWGERLGRVHLPGGCHAWIHAASLGEAGAVAPLVRELKAIDPAARLYLTATTRSGRARLERLGFPVSLAPIDSPQAVRSFFTGIAPQRIFLVETELWPHWLMRARADGVPVAIASARLSERSVGRYRGLGAPLRELVQGLAAVLCQTEPDLRRWLALGADPERTRVVGNLKNDSLPTATVPREAQRIELGLDPGRPLLVLGSVRPGEARLLAKAWASLAEATRSHWQVVAVPRHPGAARDLADEATSAGVVLVDHGAPQRGAWRWDERLGVLNDYYAAADVAFVGGTLLPYGGHNPLEPAAYGAAVILGRHTAAQQDAVAALVTAGAARVCADGAALARGFAALLEDGAERALRSTAARAAVSGLRGATERTAAALVDWRLWPVG